MAFSLLQHQQSQSQRQRQKQGNQMLIGASSTMDYIGIQRLFNHEQVPTGGLNNILNQSFGSNASYPAAAVVSPKKRTRIEGHLHDPFLGMSGCVGGGGGGGMDLNQMFPLSGGGARVGVGVGVEGLGLGFCPDDRHGGPGPSGAMGLGFNNVSINNVSTGLRLAFDPSEEPSSSITSSRPDSSRVLPDDLLSAHLSRHRDELHCLLHSQSEQLCITLRDSARRHTGALLAAAEGHVARRVRGAGAELARARRRVTELEEAVGVLGAECRAWQSKARSGEALVSVLGAELHRAMAIAKQSRENHSQAMMEEGCGESTTEPEPEPEPEPGLGSYTGENCGPDPRSRMMMMKMKMKKMMMRRRRRRRRRACKGCGSNRDASVVILPCLHLCLCASCKDASRHCPVCNSPTTGAVEVYFD